MGRCLFLCMDCNVTKRPMVMAHLISYSKNDSQNWGSFFVQGNINLHALIVHDK